MAIFAKMCHNPYQDCKTQGSTVATMNVSLPDPLKDWVEAQVEAGRYANASDYVRDLIRRDQDRKEALLDALDEGLKSGVTDYSMDEILKEAKAEARPREKRAQR